MDIIKKPDQKNTTTSTTSQGSAGKAPNSLKKSSWLKKAWPVILLIVLLAGSIFIAVFFYREYKDIKENPQKVAVDETKAIVEQVGKLMTLPQKEQPTLATVLDKEKLKDQAFFNDAQNGDKILIYTEAKKAIIYREEDNIVVNVGPILLNSDEESIKKRESIVVLYNNLAIIGLIKKCRNNEESIQAK